MNYRSVADICPFCGHPWARHDTQKCKGFMSWPDQTRLRPVSTAGKLDLTDVLQEIERRHDS